MTIESVCNQALDLIGYKRHIGHILEGSLAARIAIDIWAESRDEVLTALPWNFARAYEAMTLTGQVAHPPWRFEYIYPGSSVKLLMVKPSGNTLDPQPVRWAENFDVRVTAPGRTVLTNINQAIAVYTARVLDPNGWPAEYTEMIIRILAQKFQSSLGQGERREPRRRGESGARDSGEPQ